MGPEGTGPVDRPRWACSDIGEAIARCRKRNEQGIRCTLDALGEDVRTREEAEVAVSAVVDIGERISDGGLNGSISVKLSALGYRISEEDSRRNLFRVLGAAFANDVDIELDMEGAPMVDLTLDIALEAADHGYPITAAVQAYLDRTENDMARLVEADVGVRLVKGAYLGDIRDGAAIRERFLELARSLGDAGVEFCVGTHDPGIIEDILTSGAMEKGVEFGFLMGLGDETKLRLIGEGHMVSEYIPFGADTTGYVSRRERYLKELEIKGESPVP